MRLDRFLCKQADYSRKTVLQLLAQQQIKVDGKTIHHRAYPVTAFSNIEIQGKPLHNRSAQYYMLNKPAGFLSATIDHKHPTVLELFTGINTEQLHIAGRLDRATTGLLLLTNDGKWSRKLTELKSIGQPKIPKVYWVETAHAISPETEQRFAEGIYFRTENTTTSPAKFEIISEKISRLTIYEGRYHQVKRMYAAVGNRVVNLHREQVGNIQLDPQLTLGMFRKLTVQEVEWVFLR